MRRVSARARTLRVRAASRRGKGAGGTQPPGKADRTARSPTRSVPGKVSRMGTRGSGTSCGPGV